MIIVIFIGLTLLLSLFLVINYVKKLHSAQKFTTLKSLVENLKLYNTMFDVRCKIDYPIFFINMDKHVNRRNYMESQLNKISTDFHRVKGFNGYKITNIEQDTVEGVKFRNFYPEMSKAEIGCTISHILAIKEAYKSGKNIAMICEDDIMFDTCSLVPNMKDVVDKAPADWSILQLCISGTMDGSLAKIYQTIPKFPNISYVKRNFPKEYFWSTACYLINRAGMEKILSVVEQEQGVISIKPVQSNPVYPTYGSADVYLLDVANTYSVLPSLFAANNTELESTIHPDHTPSHIEHSLTILSAFPQISSKQVRFARTLIDMDEILTSNKQKYFLACGTVLGVVRENGFIEHDEDIDLGIFSTEYNPEIEKAISSKFKLKSRYGKIDSGYELSFVHRLTGVSIDIFLYYQDGDSFWCPSFNNICNKAKNKMCRWKYSFDSVKPVDFLRRKFLIPNPVERYLSEAYGQDWRTPKKFSYAEGLQEHYKNLIYTDFELEGLVPDVPIVWQYWETKVGSKKPGYIDYAMDTVRKSCQEDNIKYVRLSPENLGEYIDLSELPKNWHNLSEIAHKADYLRAVILYKYGGLWLDADVLAKSSFRPLLNDLKNADLVLFADEKQEFSIAIFGCRKHSPFIKEWISVMTKKIGAKTTFEWTEIGYNILYPLWKKWSVNRAVWRVKTYRDRDTCFPLNWTDWGRFFEKGTSEFLSRDFQPAIDMYNFKFPAWFKQMDRVEFENFIVDSDIVIADLYRNNPIRP